jgi:GNAT superfamily N-acetyltransferase
MSTIDLAHARRLEMAHAWRGVWYVRAQSVLHPEYQCRVEEIAGGVALYAGPGSPLNCAVGLGLHGPVSQAELERIEQFFHNCNTPTKLDICPLADESLFELVKHGGYHLEGFLNVLACSLTDDVAPAKQSEIQITRAKPEEAELWIRTTAQGFTEVDDPPQRDLANAVCFFAWIDGQPAGGGAMFIHQGAVELGGASTRPAFRKRGVQTALLQARLRVARNMGCDLAMVLTEPGSDSQRNIQRAGFELAYTKVILSKP